jgi:hypothetical protein
MPRRDVMSEIFSSLGESSHTMTIDAFPRLNRAARHLLVD